MPSSVLYLDVAGFKLRARDSLLPTSETTDDMGVVSEAVDDSAIEAALTDASGTCRAYLPNYLLGSDGDALAHDDVDARVKDVLPGICYAIARFELTDATVGENDDVDKAYDGAIETLRVLAGLKGSTGAEPISDGAPTSTTSRPKARAFDGVDAGGWIPGRRGGSSSGRSTKDTDVLEI